MIDIPQDLQWISEVDCVRIAIMEGASKISDEEVASEYSKGCFIIWSIDACITVVGLVCSSDLSFIPTES